MLKKSTLKVMLSRRTDSVSSMICWTSLVFLCVTSRMYGRADCYGRLSTENVPWPISAVAMCTRYLTPWNFFLWDLLKSLVCETLVATVEDLRPRIVVVSADIANTQDLFESVRQCFVHLC
ncbi:hypothetical protein TNCV_4811581 [Trichonephila clavipes]|nr:hypothetical protein TNCV_4811581 [Trichonephila clavipes]